MTPLHGLIVAGRATSTVVRLVGTVGIPVDPLGPIDQDPDSVREAACRLVAADDVCAPPSTRPPSPSTPPDVSSGASWLSSGLQILFWVVFIGLVVLLLVVAVRAAMRSGGLRRRRPTTDDSEPVEELARTIIDREREPLDWRREADEHRASGRIRDAIRCRYRALVGDLARLDLIDEIPGRTTGEERVQLRDVVRAAVPAFDRAADLFDDAWFGGVPVDGTDDDRMQRLDREVLETVRLSSTPGGAR